MKIIIIISISIPFLFAESHPIFMDGRFGDWYGIESAHVDSADDGDSLDFGTIHLANDDEFFFLKIEVGNEIIIQKSNLLKILMDTDNNSETGYEPGLLGAEIIWQFGDRIGEFYSNGNTTTIHQDDIGIRTFPTVSSDKFEIAFKRNAKPDDIHFLFPEDTIRVMFFESEIDSFYDFTDFIEYGFDDTPVEPLGVISFEKEDDLLIRVLTWNVLHDGIFEPDRAESFHRVLVSLQPEIINFQEINNHTVDEVMAVVEGWLPGDWFAYQYGDRTTISQFPIITDWPQSYEPIHERFTIVPIQIDENRKFVIFNAHLTCCDNDERRQLQADSFIAYLRELMIPGGEADLDEGTPFMLTGDLNLVGRAQQLETLLHGEIINQDEFGENFLYPDWDSTNLFDIITRQTEKRMAYTWRNEGSLYSPGRLDFVITSDCLIRTEKSFIICTTEMSDEQLALNGLDYFDTQTASDHLPVVVDLLIGRVGDVNLDGQINVLDITFAIMEILGVIVPNSTEWFRTDINFDNWLNVLDIIGILNVALEG